MLCPCHSKKTYQECCAPFHAGKFVEKAVLLMRSRYSAYALGNSAYIIQTTHPEHPDSLIPLETRKKSIESFCKNTQFLGLEILEEIEGEALSFVTFHATLLQKGADISFTEKSRFEKLDGKWFYKEGVICRR